MQLDILYIYYFSLHTVGDAGEVFAMEREDYNNVLLDEERQRLRT